MAELLLYNVGVQVERQFGSLKYAVSRSSFSPFLVQDSVVSFLVIRICFDACSNPPGIHFPDTLPPSWIKSHLRGPVGPNFQHHMPVL